jgi:hypothetical protein
MTSGDDDEGRSNTARYRAVSAVPLGCRWLWRRSVIDLSRAGAARRALLAGSATPSASDACQRSPCTSTCPCGSSAGTTIAGCPTSVVPGPRGGRRRAAQTRLITYMLIRASEPPMASTSQKLVVP